MHDEVRKTLRRVLQKMVACPHEAPSTSQPYLVLRRSENGGWSGSYEDRPLGLSRTLDKLGEDGGRELSAVIEAYHPDHCGLIGCSALGSWSFNPQWYLRRMAGDLLSRYPDLPVPDDAVDRMVDEYAKILDCQTIVFEVIAPLLNFVADEGISEVPLPHGVTIRRLTEDEVTGIYGGFQFVSSGNRHGIDDYALVGEFEDRKMLGGKHANGGFDDLVRSLDAIVLGLRTFQSGPVGYDRVRLMSRRLFELGTTTRTLGHEYIPLGQYHLRMEDVPCFQAHLKYVTKGLHPTIEMALRRLGDAEIRLKASDQILDAVIGMEAVLLADTEEKYRGELRYRFSLNYATLFDAPEQRIKAFHRAKDLYDLRSKVAHGGQLSSGPFRLGEEQLSEREAAKSSCEMLRFTIQKFLPSAKNPPYTNHRYWITQLFEPQLSIE